ncbi:MAG: glycosyltransferase family 4 protein [Pelotomaculum sp.]|uniref:Glycosyltransferase n=1 Tax=Pelotomaculum thermopropionicum (strain DSM 13744 / JCM 10971 / SI) TaxID=370438 RepID=A5D3B6_PELTS|nr:glycosyltransferase family 4 protein [Pelotomaculum sp.]BAF59277.1 glycosyltransferase [Pelotomaculum thermopropionicum SI]
MVCPEERTVTNDLAKSNGRPRVIHVTTIGITALRALLAQCRYFREKGLEVGFVFSPSPEGNILRRLGFPVKEIYIDRKINPWTDFRSIIKLYGFFRLVRPRIVHTHTSKAGVVGRIAASLAGVPNVLHTVHGFPFHPGMPGVKQRFYRQIEKWMAGLTHIMFSQSREDVATALELGIKPRRGDLIYIGNGVDLGEFDPGLYPIPRRCLVRKELAIGETEPVITMIGRINREKGYHDLVEALQGVKDLPWRALFIGPDEGFLPAVKKQIERSGLEDRIRVLGQRGDIADLLSVTDIYVLPSYREGLPRSLIEAQAMALPCVATDIRGCREVVEDGVTGLLVKPGDSVTLGRALRKLLLEPELRFKMGREGRLRMCRFFNEAEVARRIMAVYEEVLGNEKNSCYD